MNTNMELMLKVSPMTTPTIVRTEASREGLEKALGGKVAEEVKFRLNDGGYAYVALLDQSDPALKPNRLFQDCVDHVPFVVKGDIVIYGKDERGNISRLPSDKKGLWTFWMPQQIVTQPDGTYAIKNSSIFAFG